MKLKKLMSVMLTLAMLAGVVQMSALAATDEVNLAYNASFATDDVQNGANSLNNAITSTLANKDNGTLLFEDSFGEWKVSDRDQPANASDSIKYYSISDKMTMSVNQSGGRASVAFYSKDEVSELTRIRFSATTNNAPLVRVALTNIDSTVYLIGKNGWGNINSDKMFIEDESQESFSWKENKGLTADFDITIENKKDITLKITYNGETYTMTKTLDEEYTPKKDAPLIMLETSRGSATVNYSNVKLDYKSVTASYDNEGTVTATAVTDKANYVAILAVYDNDNKALADYEVKNIDFSDNGRNFTFAKKIGAGQSGKLFVWDNIDALTPLCDFVDVTPATSASE